MNVHERYLQQASWTRKLRAYLLEKADLIRARRVLEVGCGTGAILRDTAAWNGGASGSAFNLLGLDLAVEPLRQCRLHAPFAHLTQGDALALPFPNQAFDITYCHFLLLWVKDPELAVLEMKRVTRHGGSVLALAEPDYSARIDEPPALAALGELQDRSLARRGANTSIGARLANLFDICGLKIVETGTIASWQPADYSSQEFAGEWAVLREDLAGMLPEAELNRLMLLDSAARKQGERVLHVPTYFIHAQV